MEPNEVADDKLSASDPGTELALPPDVLNTPGPLVPPGLLPRFFRFIEPYQTDFLRSLIEENAVEELSFFMANGRAKDICLAALPGYEMATRSPYDRQSTVFQQICLGHYEMVDLLLECNVEIDPESTRDSMASAFGLALALGKGELAKKLADNGCDLSFERWAHFAGIRQGSTMKFGDYLGGCTDLPPLLSVYLSNAYAIDAHHYSGSFEFYLPYLPRDLFNTSLELCIRNGQHSKLGYGEPSHRTTRYCQYEMRRILEAGGEQALDILLSFSEETEKGYQDDFLRALRMGVIGADSPEMLEILDLRGVRFPSKDDRLEEIREALKLGSVNVVNILIEQCCQPFRKEVRNMLLDWLKNWSRPGIIRGSADVSLEPEKLIVPRMNAFGIPLQDSDIERMFALYGEPYDREKDLELGDAIYATSFSGKDHLRIGLSSSNVNREVEKLLEALR